MNYCSSCGEKIGENQKFCPNCGNNINGTEPAKKIVDPNKLVCPHCGSDNVQVQIVSQNKNTGCLMVFVYVLLALTIVGIPIMILILLLKGTKSVNKKYYVCQNCGRTFNPNPFTGGIGNSNNKNNGAVVGITIAVVIIFVVIVGVAIGLKDMDYVEFDQYQALNPQELHNDYLDNEVSAKDKYVGNYYYFTGEIFGIEEFLNDKYLEIRYTSERDNSKVIELDAYFNSADDIKDVKKGDTVTVYCKFKQRSIENYMNTVTSYSLHSCRFKTE